jgi:hypothetical protein
MQVILAVGFLQGRYSANQDCTWQISDGCPPLADFRQTRCHSQVVYCKSL